MKTILFLLLFLLSTAFAVEADEVQFFNEHYSKTEVYIPMRDGTKLFTIVYAPVDQSEKYPILLNRTPYGIPPYGEEKELVFRRGLHPGFVREGFIFVYQDVRGRFMSEGTFEHMRPHIAFKEKNDQIDESSDAWDTIDWLVKNVRNNNGRVGMWGISYPGFYALCAAIGAHPALKCVAPQAPISDWFFDDPHHHGAFFTSMIDFLGVMDIPREQPWQNWLKPYEWGTPDGYQFFLELGALSNVSKNYFGDSIAFWNHLSEHPNYDQFWQERNILPHLKNIQPAILVTGGWYDAEDLYGTFHTYQAMKQQTSANGQIQLVVGPWIHGGWARTDGDHLGNVSFEQKTSLYYRDSIELPFFVHHLKQEGNPDLSTATLFMTGRNEWQTFDSWPPEGAVSQQIFLGAEQQLHFNTPEKGTTAYDEFVSDPMKPVPYTEAIAFGMTKEYMTDDQRFAGRRPDVLVYQSEVLSEDLVLAGPLTAHLHVSTSQSAADWIVKLIDVYPSDAPDHEFTGEGQHMAGYQQMVRSEVLRGRFRNSYEQPEAFQPDEITEVSIPLQDVLHCFKKGHRIMIQVQSTWFPLVDRNPQKYVENIFKATDNDFTRAVHRVYHSREYPSYIEFRSIDGGE